MAQFGIKEVLNFTIAKYNPNPTLAEPILTVDYATVSDIAAQAERLDINGGRGNKRLLSFDHTKVASLPITLPLVDLKMLALISGDKIEEQIKDVFKKEIVIVEEGTLGKLKVTLQKTPLEGSLFVHKLEGFRDLGASILSDCTISGNVIEIENTPVAVGDEIVVFYHHKTSAAVQTMKFNPTVFGDAVTLFGDTLFRNQYTEEDEVYNFVAYKGRFQPNFTLSMNSTSATVLELTLDLYAYKDKGTQEETYYEFIKEEV